MVTNVRVLMFGLCCICFCVGSFLPIEGISFHVQLQDAGLEDFSRRWGGLCIVQNPPFCAPCYPQGGCWLGALPDVPLNTVIAGLLAAKHLPLPFPSLALSSRTILCCLSDL